MLLTVLKHLNNFYIATEEVGDYVIQDNVITGLKDKYVIGQFIIIQGSMVNDGVYRFNSDTKTLLDTMDEEFSGTIYGLRIPRELISVVQKIEEWAISQDPNLSGLQSWSNGSWSESYAMSNGVRAGWEQIFASKLKPYRGNTIFKPINI